MDDRLRPRYHFTAPANWLNDPNGLIQWQGTYHLYYQHTPDSPHSGIKHWGHAVSTDLVHWEHRPIALSPAPQGPDRLGCWSGAAVVHNGRVAFIYSGEEGTAFQRPCLAWAADASLERFAQSPRNPVIAGPPDERDATMFRDHTLWREGDVWNQVIGSGIRDVGGCALRFTSSDLETWSYEGPYLMEDPVRIAPEWKSVGWECPDVSIHGERHVLIMSLWGIPPNTVGYYSGPYRDGQLQPDTYGIVDHGLSFYAPQSFTDESGRRVMFGWLREEADTAMEAAFGWSGVMSLPRLLRVDAEGRLVQEVAPEVEALRGAHRHIEFAPCDWFRRIDSGAIDTNTLEIDSTWEWTPDAMVGINHCAAAAESERTVITLSIEDGELVLDTTESSRDSRAHRGRRRAPLELEPGTPIRLRVFIDRSVVEVVVNDSVWITSRIYPTETDRGHLHLSSTTRGSVDLYEMG